MQELIRAAMPFARMATLYHDGDVWKCACCDGRAWQPDVDQPFPHGYLYNEVVSGITFMHAAICPVETLRQALLALSQGGR